MPAVGQGQYPMQWVGIRGGRKVGFSVPTSNLTLKGGLGKQKKKKDYALNILIALPLAPPATH